MQEKLAGKKWSTYLIALLQIQLLLFVIRGWEKHYQTFHNHKKVSENYEKITNQELPGEEIKGLCWVLLYI